MKKLTDLNNFPITGPVREKQILAYINFSHSTLWRRISDNKFPKPWKDGRCTFWWAEDVRKYVEAFSEATKNVTPLAERMACED